MSHKGGETNDEVKGRLRWFVEQSFVERLHGKGSMFIATVVRRYIEV